MQNWVNGEDAPHAGSGRDGVLGRHQAQGEMGLTSIKIRDKGGSEPRLPQASDFITPRGGGYPPTISPSLLARMEGLIDTGRLCAPKIVLDEIHPGDDCHKWAKALAGLFIEESV